MHQDIGVNYLYSFNSLHWNLQYFTLLTYTRRLNLLLQFHANTYLTINISHPLMTDSVQYNNTYQQGCCKTTWAKFFPSCKCISVCSFWLSINWFCIQQPSFLLLHKSVNYSHVLYPSNPNVLLIKLQFCIFHVHQRHRQTEIVHCPTWLVCLHSV